jgi:predicted NBD/HSP70 family sugar kinase
LGHPGELLAFRSTGYAVVAVDVGGTKMFGAASDLGGKIECERYIRHQAKGEDAVEVLCKLIEGLLAVPKSAGKPICGISLGDCSGPR